MYMEPETIPILEIKSDHGTPGQYTRYAINFSTPAGVAIPAWSATGGGIIIFEFETSPTLHTNDLGLVTTDNGTVPC
jgi:hypothetical protein